MQRKRQRQRIFLSPQEVSVSVPLFAFPLSVIDGKVSSVIDVKVSSVIMSPSLKRGKRDMCGGVSYPCSSDQHASSSSFLPSSHQITQEIPKVQSPSLPERGVKRRAERQENRHEVHKRTGKKNDKKEPKKTTESEAMSPVKAPVLPSSAPAPLTSVFPDFGGTLGRQEIASRPLPFFPRPLSGVQSSFRSPVVPPMEYPPPFLVQVRCSLCVVLSGGEGLVLFHVVRKERSPTQHGFHAFRAPPHVFFFQVKSDTKKKVLSFVVPQEA
mmetsp:Transcript_30538/g.79250  ORF Transcript_30538/g.79250 Transcript_30538/m.79250 type:complete len:269 (+) Transcript_30538:65-871(+)